MPILINDTAPRAQYTATSGQTAFTVSFEFFANSDLKVYKNSTLLTLTTNYTVTGAGVTGGGTLTLVTGAMAGDIITIVRDVPVARTSDFPTSGPFNIEALNTDLDRLTAMVQQQEVLDSRSLRLDQFDTPNTLDVLPVKASRVGRVLQFNDTTGQPEAGPTSSEIANAQTYATNASTSATAAAASASAASASAGNASTSATNAASSASAASTSASNASSSASAASTSASNASTSASAAAASETAAAGSASTASTQASNAASSASAASTSASNAATSASNASTSESNASSSASAASASQIAAAASAAAAAASYDSFDDRYLGSKTSDPTLDNDGNALVTGALYYNSTSGGMKVYDGANWIAASSAGTASLLNYRYVATAGQTSFSGADATGATMSYTASNLIVSRNGVVLDPTDYTATNGTTIILVNAAQTGDNINVVAFKSFTAADAVSKSGDTMTGALTVQTSAYLATVSGNVGIGTSSPAYKLHVNGIGQFDGGAVLANNTWINCKNTSGTNRDSFGYFTDNNLYVTAWDGEMILRAGGATERMRITSGGQVGINASNPISKFTCYQSAVGNNIESSSPSSGITHFLVQTSLGTGGGSDALGVYDAGGLSARITTHGYYQSRPNSYGSTSDERLKDNIVDATPKLADIMQVRVRNFNYKDQPGEKQLGVIAQELEEVFPGLVHEIPNANPELTDSDTVKSVKYSVFVPMLIKAVQEQQAQIEELKARVTALEGAAP